MGITAQRGTLGGVQVQCHISHVLTPKTSFGLLLHNIISGETPVTETGQDQVITYFMSFYLFTSTSATEIWDVLCGGGLVYFNFDICSLDMLGVGCVLVGEFGHLMYPTQKA